MSRKVISGLIAVMLLMTIFSNIAMASQVSLSDTEDERNAKSPKIIDTNPTNNEMGVEVTSSIMINFDRKIRKGNKFNSITMQDESGEYIDINPAISGDTSISIRPVGLLEPGTEYSVYIPPSAVADDENRNDFTLRYSFSFTTRGKKQPKGNVVNFTDIDSHWAKNDIEYLASLGAVSGRYGSKFEPEGTVTRAEFTKMIVAALKIPLVNGNANFSDVDQRVWYYQWIETGYVAGIVSGNGSKFRPNDKITRQEMASIIVKALNYKKVSVTADPSVLNKFKDKRKIETWAQDGVAKSVKAGILTGNPSGLLAPLDNATRAEAAVMISRLLNKIIESGQ